MTALTRLKQLTEAATPGPWSFHPGRVGGERHPCFTFEHEKLGTTARITCGPYWNTGDGHFIAAVSPQTILALLELIEAGSLCRDRAKGTREAVDYDAKRQALEEMLK